MKAAFQSGARARDSADEAVDDPTRPAVVVFDAHGMVRRWDVGAERLYGHPAADMVGGHITILMPPEARADWRRVLDRVQAGDRVLERAAVHLTRGGHRVHVEAEWSPLGTRPRSGGVLTAVDRTERVISEREHTALLSVATAASTTGSGEVMCSVAARALHGGLQPRATMIQLMEADGLRPVARLGFRTDAAVGALDAIHGAARLAHESGKVAIATDVAGMAAALSTRREAAS